MYDNVKCKGCEKNVQTIGIRAHIKKCSSYNPKVLKIIELLNSVDELKFFIEQLDLAREQAKQKIGKKIQNISFMSAVIMDPEIVQCQKCLKKFYASFDVQLLVYSYQCLHLFCKPCFVKYIDVQYVNKLGQLLCPAKNCKFNISEFQIKEMIGQKKLQILSNKMVRKMMNLVECVKCKQSYEVAEGNPDHAPKKSDQGKQLTALHASQYAKMRFVCPIPACKVQQCKGCQASPFHTGYTCAEFKAHVMSIKCRYCDEPLTTDNKVKNAPKCFADICSSEQCQQLAKTACTTILPCKHPCCGIKNQKKCLPCLQCEEDNPQLIGQSGDDYCAICYVQSLKASPSFRSICGHILHLKCAKKRLQIKWLTPRIMFNYCLCPLCKKWIQVPPQNELNNLLIESQKLFTLVQNMSLERLKFQQCLKDPKLLNSSSPYYKKPNQFAMAIYAYFMCFKCKKPYFGGRKQCANGMDQNVVNNVFKPEQLVCANCCDIPIQNCPKHGKDFIEFKCKFCCNIAQWFCWGNTHFCEDCHKKQCNGDYLNRYEKSKLPKCQGPGKCPVGGNHNGNGDQIMLGCAICRNFKENNKNF